MSSIAQGVLMALTVTVNKYNSSDVQSVHRTKKKKRPISTTTTQEILGRRALLLSSASEVAATTATANASNSELLQKYLKKTEENKAKNDKERLDSYYKRNYKDYFDFVEGSLKGKTEPLSESEKGILDWLRSNK